VRHVVGAVEVLAVPAGWEAQRGHYSGFAFVRGEGDGFGGALSPGVHADVGELAEVGSFREGARREGAGEHAEALGGVLA